jgi:hypothetical protein
MTIKIDNKKASSEIIESIEVIQQYSEILFLHIQKIQGLEKDLISLIQPSPNSNFEIWKN